MAVITMAMMQTHEKIKSFPITISHAFVLA